MAPSKKTETAMTKTNPRSYAQGLIANKLGGKSSDAMAGVETLDDSQLAALFDTYEMNPPVVVLHEGQAIRGKLVGEGSPVETASSGKDPKTGEAIPGSVLKTWVIDTGNGVKVRIVGGYQLNTDLPKLVGKSVIIVKGRKVDTGRGGQQVREWLIGSLNESDDVESTDGSPE